MTNQQARKKGTAANSPPNETDTPGGRFVSAPIIPQPATERNPYFANPGEVSP